MEEIKDSAIPKGAGIITFEMIYRASQKLGTRVDRLEKEIDELKKPKEIEKKIEKEIPKPELQNAGLVIPTIPKAKVINITENKEDKKDEKKVK